MLTRVPMKIRTYSELIRLDTFESRYNYLRLVKSVGESTFGFDRYLNQLLYSSVEWRRTRDKVIVRDNGFDLAYPDYVIGERIIIHHLNPLTIEDIENGTDKVFDLEGLVCASNNTHLAIHFGSVDSLPQEPLIRESGDTNLWKRRR